MMTKRLSLLLVMMAGAWGCDAATGSDPALPPVPPESAPVAAIALAQGQQFEIYEQTDGSFAYSQAGRYGVAPATIPEALWQEGDPLKIWRQLAPSAAVPAALTAAVERSVLRARALTPATVDDGPRQPLASGGSPAVAAARGDGIEQTQQAELGSRDTTTSNSTGSPGCPFQFFQIASQENRLFCPSGTNSWCQQNMAWAFHSNTNAAGAWGAVCTDFGTHQFKVSNGDQNVPVATFAVSAGTWRYVRFASFQSCGWFSCSTVRNFKKFDLANAVFGPASSHFGGKIE